MSIESAKAFVERLKTDENFGKECSEKSSPEDWVKFAKDNGYDFSKEEFEQVKSVLCDEELDSLGGGHNDGSTHTGF
ncbi:MAG: Nif11-like leader peptide family natural product precursor [bacterium]|nr:Nif11-like leader peptide family natural product precursor [bacterium]